MIPLADAPWQWFLDDPLGRMIGIGLAVVISLVILYQLLKVMSWAANHRRQLFIGAVVIGAVVWGVQFIQPSTTTWVIIGMVAFGGFFGYALYLTQGGK